MNSRPHDYEARGTATESSSIPTVLHPFTGYNINALQGASEWKLPFCIAAVVIIGLIARAINPAFVGDQLELLEFSAEWRWVYDEQMPLYAWIATGLLHLTGGSVFALDALKYAALAGIITGIHRAAENLVAGSGLTAVALAFLIPTIGVDAQAAVTHSGPLLAATAWSTALLTARAGRPEAGFWWKLGAVWAVGLVFKHSMALVIAAQVLAVLSLRRPALRKWIRHLAAAGALALAMAAPFYLLMAMHAGTVTGGMAEFYPETGWSALQAGLLDAITSPLSEAGLVVLIGMVAAWIQPGPKWPHPIYLEPGRAGALFILLVLAASLMSGASLIRDRWLAPGALMLVPAIAAHILQYPARKRRRIADCVAITFIITTARVAAHRTAFG